MTRLCRSRSGCQSGTTSHTPIPFTYPFASSSAISDHLIATLSTPAKLSDSSLHFPVGLLCGAAITTSVVRARPPLPRTRQLHLGPWIQGPNLTHQVNLVGSEESESSSRRQARASMAKYVGERAGAAALRQVGHVERERSTDSRVEIRGEALKVLVQFGESYNAWTGELHVGTENTIGELKKRLSQIHHIPVKLQMLRLKCTKGNALDVDETTLIEAGVRNGDKLLLAGRQSWYPTMAPPEESAREELLKYEDFAKRMDPVGFWANEDVGTDPDSR